MDVIRPQFAMYDHQDENCHNPVREEGYLFWKTSAQGKCFLMHSAKPVRRTQCEFGFHSEEIPDETLSV
jgi:hypothetical protein